MPYASVAEVNTYTGVSVSAAAVTKAQTLIELYSNRTEASSGTMSARDLYWLKLATAYQAAYMDAHPELFNLMDAKSYSQGDISISFRDNSDATMIAPLAKRALQTLSWNRSRSVTLSSDFVLNEDIINADEVEYHDDSWESF